MAMSSNFPQNHRGGDSLSVRAINNGKMAIYNSWKKILNKLPTRQNSFLMLLLSTAKETSIIMPTASIRKPRREILVLSLGTTPTRSWISYKRSWQIGAGRMETPGERGMMRIRQRRQSSWSLRSLPLSLTWRKCPSLWSSKMSIRFRQWLCLMQWKLPLVIEESWSPQITIWARRKQTLEYWWSLSRPNFWLGCSVLRWIKSYGVRLS